MWVVINVCHMFRFMGHFSCHTFMQTIYRYFTTVTFSASESCYEVTLHRSCYLIVQELNVGFLFNQGNKAFMIKFSNAASLMYTKYELLKNDQI